MFSDKQNKNLMICDFLGVVISFIGLIVTIILLTTVIETQTRQLFIIQLFILGFVFSRYTNSVNEYLKQRKK